MKTYFQNDACVFEQCDRQESVCGKVCVQRVSEGMLYFQSPGSHCACTTAFVGRQTSGSFSECPPQSPLRNKAPHLSCLQFLSPTFQLWKAAMATAP